MKITFTLFLSLMLLQLSAQISTEKRLELELNDDYNNEKIYEFGKKGFLIFAQSDTKEDKQYRWKYDHYSVDLSKEKNVEILLPKNYRLEETFRTEDKIYQLFKDKGDFKIISMDIATLQYETVEVELEKKTFVSSLAVLNNIAYMTAGKSGKSFILAVNLKTNERNFYPIEIEGFKDKEIAIENIQLLNDSKELFVFLEAKVGRKLSKTYVVRLDDQGNKKGVYDFSKNLTEIVTSATASFVSGNKYIFTGTYSKKSRNLSEGMFFSIVDGGTLEKINFYNFTDLDNFLNYLSERKQEKLEKKKEKKEAKGKELTLRYYLAPHNIIQTDDGYIYIAEAYYPTYRTEFYTTTSYVNGQAVTTRQSRQVFDGFQYTHAFLAKFNKEGEKEWDQSFKMWMAYKPFYPKRFINIAEKEQNSVKLVYASMNRINSKKIDFDGKVLSEEESDEIETDKEGDKTKFSFSNITYWYDTYFLAYGSQTIKNKTDEDVARKRRVFFINKIKFD